MAVPKLSVEKWAKVRSHWEMDPRAGFAWIVRELALPVSAPGVRKAALKDGWMKLCKKSEEDDQVADKIPAQWALFCREYLVDFNGTQAAIRAGYPKPGAHVQAARLLRNAKVVAALTELQEDRLKRLEVDADDLVARLNMIVSVDVNELVQYRRNCCPHCWGPLGEDAYSRSAQFTPDGYAVAKARHTNRRAKILKDSDQSIDIGDFPGVDGDWYDSRREPNPTCPECWGDGLGEVFIQDTRYLSPAARALYAGVRETRDGVEVLTYSREKAVEQLARALGVFRDDRADLAVSVMAPEQLTSLFWDKLQGARDRQASVLIERGIVDE